MPEADWGRHGGAHPVRRRAGQGPAARRQPSCVRCALNRNKFGRGEDASCRRSVAVREGFLSQGRTGSFCESGNAFVAFPNFQVNRDTAHRRARVALDARYRTKRQPRLGRRTALAAIDRYGYVDAKWSDIDVLNSLMRTEELCATSPISKRNNSLTPCWIRFNENLSRSDARTAMSPSSFRPQTSGERSTNIEEFQSLCDRVSARAKNRGLTKEKLDALLND